MATPTIMPQEKAPMWDTFEEDMADAAGRRSVLDACPETAAIRLERPRLDAGEPWCVTQLAGL